MAQFDEKLLNIILQGSKSPSGYLPSFKQLFEIISKNPKDAIKNLFSFFINLLLNPKNENDLAVKMRRFLIEFLNSEDKIQIEKTTQTTQILQQLFTKYYKILIKSINSQTNSIRLFSSHFLLGILPLTMTNLRYDFSRKL